MWPMFSHRTAAGILAALVATASPALCQGADGEHQGRVLGLAFVGRLVADLDQSVAFYKAIGFSQGPRSQNSVALRPGC